MTDDLGFSDAAEATVTRGEPVVASWLVKVVARGDGVTVSPSAPTNEQLEEAIRTMVAASWHGLMVTASAERTDR